MISRTKYVQTQANIGSTHNYVSVRVSDRAVCSLREISKLELSGNYEKAKPEFKNQKFPLSDNNDMDRNVFSWRSIMDFSILLSR